MQPALSYRPRKVSVSTKSGKSLLTQKVDAHGAAILPLAPAEYIVRVGAPGCDETSEEISVSGPMTLPVPLRVSSTGNPLVIYVPPYVPIESSARKTLISEIPLSPCKCTRIAQLALARRR